MAVRETPMAGRNALRRRLISLAVASALAGWGGGALANPNGANVAVGSATITVNGKTLTVVNTPGAVINWQQFSIQKDEITRFLQQNAASAVLNRVRGGDPSVILGQLLSNGRVFLINPSGIAIGKGAVIDVAGFAASTLNISDADWISGKLRFEGTGLEGKLENAGTIKTAQGGHVYLIAPKVENKPDGVIQSPQGEVIVAAGKTVELVNAGTPDIRVEYTAPDNSAVNAGRIVAAGGRVGIYGTLVKNSGLVSATHAEVGKGGKIVFRATKDVELDPGSKVEANGTQGGEITVQADSGAIRAQGTIEANGTETGGLVALRAAQAIDVPAGGAVSATGAGGKVELVAKNAEAAPTEVHIGGKIEAGATVSIDAPQGRTQLDSGAVISAPEIKVASKVFAGEGALDASGAQGGRVEIEVDSIDWAGSVFAAGTVSDGGVVHVVAQDSVEIAPSSIVRVDGAQRGGEVSIRAVETEVLLAGTVSARGLTTGGEITVTAPKVETQDAVLDASGALGGGRVRLGGDYQGGGDLPQARQTYVDLYTRIRADAETEGDGGTIVVWSTDLTWFAGTASVRGGAVSGDGGLVETSSKGALSVTGRVDASAPNGQLGIFLLDPTNIVVASGGGAATTDVDQFADAGTNVTIDPATLDAANATVILQATNDITISDAVDLSDTTGAGFVAQAGNDIIVNASITTDAGVIHLEADSPHSGGAYDGSGQVKINAQINTCGGAVLASCGSGGNITLIGGGNSTPDGGFALNADVIAGDGGINVAMSLGGSLDFYIGAGGNTQLSSKDTGSLKTTGALVLGKATTAGTDGSGASAINLLVDSITNETASPIQLSTESGSSFELYAGDGGITLSRPLTTYQDTVIDTTGDLYVNQTLSTSDNDLTITAANVILGANGSIDVGGGVFSCSGSGCGALTNVYWDGGAGTLNWFDAANWSGNTVPTASNDVTIGTGYGTIVITGGTAAAKSLTALSPVQIDGTGILNLTNSSSFAEDLDLAGILTVSKPTMGTNFLTVSGTTGALAWSGGTIGTTGADSGTGAFFLSGDSAATLSNALSLNLEYQNAGATTLSNGTVISGTGSFTNLSLDSLVVASGTTATVNVPLSSSGTAAIDGTLNVGTLALSGTGIFGGSGTLSVTTDFSGSSNLLGAGFANLTLTKSGNFAIDTSGLMVGNALTLVASGDIALNGALTAGGTVTLSSTGNVSQTAAIAANGLELRGAGGAYTLSHAGNDVAVLAADTGSVSYSDSNALTIGLLNSTMGISATGLVDVRTQSGDLTLNSAIGTTSTSANAVTLIADAAATPDATGSGGNFINAGSVAITTGAGGAWRVYTGNPTETARGGLTEDAKRYGVDDGSDPIASGNRIYFRIQPTLTLTADDKTKTYGDANPTFTYGASGLIDGDLLADAVSSGPSFSVDGTTSTSGQLTAGTPHNITLSGATPDLGYSISYVDGSLTVDQRALTISATGQNKVYDGTTSATVTLGDDRVAGDLLTTSYGSAAFLDKNVGTGKTVNVAGIGLTGTDAANYTFNTTAATTADISPAAVTISALDVSKEFDNTLGAAGTASITSGTLYGSDSLSGGTFAYTDKKVGIGNKTVTVSGATISDGNGGANYSITYLNNTTSTITPSAAFGFQWDTATAVSLSWEDGTNWNQGVAPINNTTVTIPSGLAGPVVYSAASGATDLLSLSSNSGLRMTGGTLNIAGSANIAGGFTQTAGVLDVASALNLSGPNIIVQGTTSAGSLSVSTPGSLTVSAGANPASLTSATDTSLQIGGNLLVQGGSGTDASATLANGPGTLDALVSGSVIITGGSGNGAFALIQGNPDVGALADPMSIGGTLTITTGTGSGAFARLESTSASTVYLYFPNLSPTDYGYTVDGVVGRIANGQTGIFAGGLPATLGSGTQTGIPGQSLPPDANLVTLYGILAPLLQDIQQTQSEVFYRTDQIAAMNNLTDSLSGNNDDEFDDKAAPACQ